MLGRAIAIALATLSATGLYIWWRDVKNAPQDSTTTSVGTDKNGNKIINITGVKGADSGKTVTGYELPDKATQNTFPLTVVVKPNQTLYDFFTVGQTVTFPKRNGQTDTEVVWQGKIGDASGDYRMPYDMLKQQVLGVPIS